MTQYGTVKHVKGYWMVWCEPQVRARLKRVFARAPQEAGDVVKISDAPENSRDLEWFLKRYPMKVEDCELLADGANHHRHEEALIADFLAGRTPPLSITMEVPPREYQTQSARLLEIKNGLLLADDVGLGKTVTAICSFVMPGNLPAVVVAPPHMLLHWKRFVKQCTPGLYVKVVKTGHATEFMKPRTYRGRTVVDRMPDVIVISYFRLRRWADILGSIAKMVVFDECQQLRNPGSDIYRSCVHLASRARRRLGLSATPIYNFGSEFFWVVDVLLRGSLGTREEFVREWCNAHGGDKARIHDTELFGSYLRREGIMLRRTRVEVGRELPALKKVVHEIEADLDTLEKMTGDAVKLAKIILSHGERFRGEHMQASAEFDMMLRQATGMAKAPYVAQFVRMLVENGEKVVLFGWHRAVYAIWNEHLKDLNPVMHTGSESPTEKEAALTAFKTGKSMVLMMSLRSGAGVDGLQHVCRTAVVGELDWSPGVHEQCVGRIYRDGQPDPVIAYFLVTTDGSDPVVSDVVGIKREQIEGVRNPGGPLAERVETGENNLRQLARDFLKRRGVEVPAQSKPEQLQPEEQPA